MTVWTRRLAGVAATAILSIVGLAPLSHAEPAPAPANVDPTLPASYEETRLATNGVDGFTCYRIPALTTANDGTVLASWDGRPGSCGDAPNPNSIVLRTSDDNGLTWSEPRVIAQGVGGDDQVGYSDPSFVVDRETGDIFNFFVQSYDWGWHQGGNNPPSTERQVMHAVYIKSSDHGQTWSEPVRVTEALDPNGDGTVVNGRFAASGEGIQLRTGAHAGRLIQQYTVRDISKGGGMYAVSLYSDDHGETWQAGEPVGPNMDENKVVELSDGRVMLNSRSSGSSGGRWIAYSDDGAETWTGLTFDTQLTDPRNNASIIRAFPLAEPGTPESKILLFSNANSASSRANGTIRISYDDGQTWPDSKVFQAGGMSYSTLTTLADGTIGLLYEPGGSNIQFAKFTWNWLEPGGVTAEVAEPGVVRGANTVSVTLSNPGLAGDLEAGTLTVEYPEATGSVAVPALAGQGQVTVELPLEIGQFVDPGPLTLAASYRTGERTFTLQLPLEVTLAEGQYASEVAPRDQFSVIESAPAQAGEGPERMLDGANFTLYHTLYAGIELPDGFVVDLGSELQLAYLDLTPRSDGANGKIGQYRIEAGSDLADLQPVAEGTWPASASSQRAYLDGVNARYVKVVALSSYGDTPNSWLSVAEFNVRTVGEEPEQQPLQVEMTLAGTPAASYAVGDLIPVNLRFTNLTDQPLSAQSTTSGWEGLAGCAVEDLAAGTSVDCEGQASYRVTQADLERAYVDLSQVWSVEQSEVQVSGPRVNLGIIITNLGVIDVPEVIEAGTVLTYRFEYQNLTERTVAVVPLEGDFGGFHITGTPNCRYGALAPTGSTPKFCNTAVYTVTQQDLDAGQIAPAARFAVGPNTNGTDPYFEVDVPAPVLRLGEDLPVLTEVDPVDPISVPFGTDLDGVLALLPTHGQAQDSAGGTHEVEFAWEVVDYDGSSAQTYPARATFALPDGVEAGGIDPVVETSVTVEPAEVTEPKLASVTPVDSITVEEGTDLVAVLAQLPATTTVTDTEGTSYQVELTWEVTGYDANVPGTYRATGSFALPEGVAPSDEVDQVVTTGVIVEAKVVPSPTPTEPPAPKPGEPKDPELADTGANLWLPVGLAGLLVVAGGVALRRFRS
ncbi:exo-alpha-sialidase [Scrofimicrobium sp. R131]|uniref:exo-alpha-sialidase n=1 Tax=Scrofimicrobium appendicitidis TaxID=3079930 RepID=A0AAU7V7E5_9ACTO